MFGEISAQNFICRMSTANCIMSNINHHFSGNSVFLLGLQVVLNAMNDLKSNAISNEYHSIEIYHRFLHYWKLEGFLD